MNFYDEYYELYRDELVRFACGFTRSMENAEDLFEDSHIVICKEYPCLKGDIDYLKLMKTFIGNKYKDQWRHLKVQNSHPQLPTEQLDVEEQLFQKLELKWMMESLKQFYPEDFLILFSDQDYLSGKMRVQKSRAKKKVLAGFTTTSQKVINTYELSRYF